MLGFVGRDDRPITPFRASDRFAQFDDDFINRWLVIQALMAFVINDLFLVAAGAHFSVRSHRDNDFYPREVFGKDFRFFLTALMEKDYNGIIRQLTKLFVHQIEGAL